MSPIPYAKTYRTTLRGTIPKLVQCEQCAFEYVYMLEATAVGEGTSLFFLNSEGARQRSTAQAEALLQQNLNQGCEVVPCPACGTVQQHMLCRARQLHCRWMRMGAFLAFALAGFLMLAAGVYTLIDATTTGLTGETKAFWVAIGAVLGAGLGLLILRGRLARNYDPNAAPTDLRKHRGQELAVSKKDFLMNANSDYRTSRRYK
jgi:hypothetical protein